MRPEEIGYIKFRLNLEITNILWENYTRFIRVAAPEAKRLKIYNNAPISNNIGILISIQDETYEIIALLLSPIFNNISPSAEQIT